MVPTLLPQIGVVLILLAKLCQELTVLKPRRIFNPLLIPVLFKRSRELLWLINQARIELNLWRDYWH